MVFFIIKLQILKCIEPQLMAEPLLIIVVTVFHFFIIPQRLMADIFVCNAVSHAEYIQQMLASSHGCATEFTAIIHVTHPRNVDEIGEIDRLAKSTAE